MAASPLYAAGDSGSDFLTLLRRIAAGDPLATAEFLKSSSMPIPLMRRSDRMGPDSGTTMEIPGTTHRATGDFDSGVALPPWKGPAGLGPGSPMLEIPGITPELLKRIAQRESSGKPTARGKKGERGKFQIMPETAAMYGIKDPALLENPQVAEYVARRYLTDLYHQFGGDLTKTLEAYNAGPGRVRSGNIPEASKRYAQAILSPSTEQGGRQAVLQTPTQPRPESEAKPGILERLGIEGTAHAEEPYTGPVLPMGGGGAAPSAAPTEKPYSGPVLSLSGGPGPREKLKNILESKAGPESIYPSTRVRQALGYAPMIGQIGADVAFGPEALLAKAGAAGIGTEVGEQARILGDVATRRKPVSSLITRQPEAFESASEAAAVTAAADPILRKASSLIPGRRVAQGAGALFRKGSEAVEDLTGRIGRSLGMSEQAASHAASTAAARQPMRQAISTIRGSAQRAFSELYDEIIRRYGLWRTPGEIMRSYDAERAIMAQIDKMELPISRDIPTRVQVALEASRGGAAAQVPMTVQREQRLVSDLKTIQRALPEGKGEIAASLGRMIAAGEKDITDVLRLRGPQFGDPQAAENYLKLNRDYGDMLRQVAGRKIASIRDESGLPAMARRFWAREQNQLMEAFKYADKLPPAEREATYSTLRKSYAMAAYDAAGAARGLDRLTAMRVFISKTPPEVLAKLYGNAAAAERGEILHSAELADAQFKKILGNRSAREAMINAFREHVAQKPGLLRYLMHRATWAALILAGGHFSGEMGAAVGIGGAAWLIGSALHSSAGLQALEGLATAPTADQVGRWMARIAEAEMAEKARRGAALARSKTKKETTP